MTTPREDAIAALLDVDRLMDAIVAAEEATGWDLNVGEGVLAEAIAREYAALGAEAETPDRSADPYWRGYSDGLHAALGQMPVVGAEAETPDPVAWCEACGYAHRPDDGDCVDAPSGHWVDLASPETAEALARALTTLDPDTGQDDWQLIHVSQADTYETSRKEWAAAILAAMRETGL